MKAVVGFLFFILFLAGFALVNLKSMRDKLPTVEELSASEWRPTNLNELTLAPDTVMLLQFEADQRVNGHSGCNRFFSSYELDGANIAFGQLGGTRMACHESDMALEKMFLDALSNTKTIAHAEDRLALRNDDGEVVMRLVAVPVADL